MIQRSTAMLKILNEKLVVEALHRYLSRSFIEEKIEVCGAKEKKQKKLTTVMVVFLILYACLFRQSNRKEALKKLVEGYQIREWRIPGKALATRSGISKALKRAGAKVMKSCYEGLAAQQQPSEASFYKGLRLKAYDGSCLNLEDSQKNREAYGKPSTGQGESAWPQMRLVMEVDAGTRHPLKIAYGGYATSELALAEELLGGAGPKELILIDRYFGCFRTLERIQDQGAEFLVRVKQNQKIPGLKQLRDGSYLGLMRDSYTRKRILVRVIEYRLLNRGQEVFRFATSLLDEKSHPALELIELYHRRWEIEISFDELKNHLWMRRRYQPFFRAQTPKGVVQELYGLMMIYFVIRSLMQEAAQKYDLDPRRLSFNDCVQILKRGVVRMQAARTETLPMLYEDLLDEMAGTLLPPADHRINPRVVKKHHAKFPSKHPGDIGSKPTSRFTDTVRLSVCV